MTDNLDERRVRVYGIILDMFWKSAFSFVVLGVFVVALGVWLGSGFYTVQPGEQAALRNPNVIGCHD